MPSIEIPRRRSGGPIQTHLSSTSIASTTSALSSEPQPDLKHRNGTGLRRLLTRATTKFRKSQKEKTLSSDTLVQRSLDELRLPTTLPGTPPIHRGDAGGETWDTIEAVVIPKRGSEGNVTPHTRMSRRGSSFEKSMGGGWRIVDAIRGKTGKGAEAGSGLDGSQTTLAESASGSRGSLQMESAPVSKEATEAPLTVNPIALRRLLFVKGKDLARAADGAVVGSASTIGDVDSRRGSNASSGPEWRWMGGRRRKSSKPVAPETKPSVAGVDVDGIYERILGPDWKELIQGSEDGKQQAAEAIENTSGAGIDSSRTSSKAQIANQRKRPTNDAAHPLSKEKSEACDLFEIERMLDEQRKVLRQKDRPDAKHGALKGARAAEGPGAESNGGGWARWLGWVGRSNSTSPGPIQNSKPDNPVVAVTSDASDDLLPGLAQLARAQEAAESLLGPYPSNPRHFRSHSHEPHSTSHHLPKRHHRAQSHETHKQVAHPSSKRHSRGPSGEVTQRLPKSYSVDAVNKHSGNRWAHHSGARGLSQKGDFGQLVLYMFGEGGAPAMDAVEEDGEGYLGVDGETGIAGDHINMVYEKARLEEVELSNVGIRV
ncbi:hypothetical protein HK104_000768 [Borealophlyctis nickersoniae]|nr:hypothetical protein HK104_000768 [Borealophlyctis nickersoniae]